MLSKFLSKIITSREWIVSIPKRVVKQLSRKDNVIKCFNPIKHAKLGAIQFTFNERYFNFVAPYLTKDEASSKTSTSSVTPLRQLF